LILSTYHWYINWVLDSDIKISLGTRDQLKDIDRYRLNTTTHKTWSGIELSSLVRKYLSLLRNVPDIVLKNKDISPEERLDLVMRQGYPELPNQISFQFGSFYYEMPLFLYILRKTFWQPQDVLRYYANLLVASDSFRKTKTVMPFDLVRQVIAASTRIIVEDDFIVEFETSFRNLRKILACFRHGPQVIDWDYLKKKIENVQFDSSLHKEDVASLEWKVEILYDIGVLGVVLPRKTAEKLSAFHHAFSFNEDQLLTRKLAREDYPRFKYALNPIFSEYLQLDTSEKHELILPIDWKYLHRNEILRGLAPMRM
jgi:hypothetical protein